MASLATARRALTCGGFAAALMASCAPTALYAETSNADLAREIAELKAQIREMKGALAATRSETRRTSVKVREVASRGPVIAPPSAPPMAMPVGATPVFVTADKKMQYGSLTITPGGFLAGESVYRTRTVNSDVNTAYNNIPFLNSPLGHTDEFRPSARQTRLALLVEAPITPNMFASGYVEMDFLGAAPTANSNQTNSYTPRIRHLYAALDWNDTGWHMLAGQNWSLVTLNSKGITPRNEVTPTVIDSAQTVGSIYARQPQVRLTKDFNKKLWLSVSAEESETTFNPACSTNPGGQVLTPGGNAGITGITQITCGALGAGAFSNGTTYSLNHAPDVVGKIAYEAKIADRDVHLEAMGLYTNFFDRVAYADGTFANKNTSGYGVGGGLIAQLFPKKLDFQINALYGNGVNRYGPGQITEATFNPNGSLKPVKGLVALAGLTYHATPALDFYGYAGIEQIDRSFFQQANGTYVGFGTPTTNNTGCYVEGSANCTGATKRLLELTGGFWDKLYKGNYGEVRVGVQYAYVQREIFGNPGGNVALAASPDIRTYDHMVLTSFRYFPFAASPPPVPVVAKY